MHMRDDQGLDALHVKAERRSACALRCLGALLQAAVDQQAGKWSEMELVTRASNAAGTTVMGKAGIVHAAHTHLGQK